MEKDSTNQFMSFADSEISAITCGDGIIRILFSAANVRQHNPENGSRPLEGYARGVEFILTGTNLEFEDEGLMGRVSFGRAMLDNKWTLQIPLPCSITGRIAMEISFANQSHLEIEATDLECRFTGEPNFFESMAC
ncbi:hypothetical protein [Azohydromonas lata]|uniref:Uncharacterized protein n=1 Tax=Azohydromonas lata TaxID=45677 RepID=A0ABU5I8L9_9BURK|nr:hypothetical protein [Azohydromonas lata]MDZ5455440.1 hypothetical protein [Azohydromonas lata]